MTKPKKNASLIFPAPGHDHRHCATAALKKADVLCQALGKKLTDIRKRVLKEVWGSHAPVGAYDILAKLNEDGGRIAPMAVYRALEFLMENGLVHRVTSLNAFVGCAHPDRKHAAGFLICRECGSAAELDGETLSKALNEELTARGFSVDSQVIELSGTCPHCSVEKKHA
jgi:Fur family zinc uptake transcriptional regulator